MVRGTPLQELSKLIDAKPRLPDDGAQRPWLEVSTRMDGHGDGACRIARIHEHMVTADNTVHNKAGSLECANDRAPAYDGQSSARHT